MVKILAAFTAFFFYLDICLREKNIITEFLFYFIFYKKKALVIFQHFATVAKISS